MWRNDDASSHVQRLAARNSKNTELVIFQDLGGSMLHTSALLFSEGDLQKDQTESKENPKEGEGGDNAGR